MSGALSPPVVASFTGLWVTGTTGLVLAALYLFMILVAQGIPVVIAYQMPKLTPETAGRPQGRRRVSVIIPARNEVEALGACLDGLLAQDYARETGLPLEIIVVDDGSTDGTGELARRHPASPVVLTPPPLPAGWSGKCWACAQGVPRATGELLLFMDADVHLAPETVRAAVAAQEETKADLVSFAARIVMKGLWERLVLPYYAQFVLVYFVAPRVNLDHSSRAMANGQFMLFTREGYARCGGHERVKGAIIEDVRLAQETKRAGGKVRLWWAPDLVWTRMYSNRHEMREGVLKSLHGTDFSTARQVAFAVAILLGFLSPWAVIVAALILGSLLWLVVGALALALVVLKQVGFQHALRAPLRDALLYPIGCLVWIGMIGTSIARGWGEKTVTWKGRAYDMDGGRPG